MLESSKIEQIARQITDSIPAGLKGAADQVEGKVKQVLQTQLSKLDFVSREELDVQVNMVLHLRQRLEALEQRVVALEQAAEASTAESSEAPATGE